jgi:hypothetical protein
MPRLPRKNKKAPELPDDTELKDAVEKCIRRIAGPTEAAYLRVLLLEVVRNNAIPISLLDHIPAPAAEVGKTRFDQLYDAAVALVYPGYSKETLERLLGPVPKKGVKIWRVVLPEKFKIAHVLIRAESFQQAFALGCDYACRMSLRLYGRIPVDMTIRVIYMTERALRRHLELRWANRTSRRRKLKLEGREITQRQLNGVRLFALGSTKSPLYSVARYCEKKDLDRVRKFKGLSRESSVESESRKT